MKRITFLIDSMSGGGAERQLATLANELVNEYVITTSVLTLLKYIIVRRNLQIMHLLLLYPKRILFIEGFK